ncbi:hypothetical protein ACLB2K_076384 [Fragaria x ananassa]
MKMNDALVVMLVLMLLSLTHSASNEVVVAQNGPGDFASIMDAVDAVVAQDGPGDFASIMDAVDAVVAQDGLGDFASITDAVDAVLEDNPDRFIIRIKAGVYDEIVNVGKKKLNVVFIVIEGDDFLATGITFENSAWPEAGQAVAVRSSSYRTAFYRCRIAGFQDTLYTQDGVQFFRECEIYVQISDVSFKNIKGSSSSPVAVKLDCSHSAPCRNVELSDIDLTYNGDEKEKITSECYNVQPRITSVTKALACATMGDIPPEGDTPPSPTVASDDPSAPGTMTNGYYPHTLPRPYEVQAAGSTFGNYFRGTTYGESHGGGVGCVIDGVPPWRPLSEADLQPDLDRRIAVTGDQVRAELLPRKETVTCKILSGVQRSAPGCAAHLSISAVHLTRTFDFFKMDGGDG